LVLLWGWATCICIYLGYTLYSTRNLFIMVWVKICDMGI